MDAIHAVLKDIILSELPSDNYEHEIRLITTCITLLSGQDERIRNILEDFLINIGDAELCMEQTDMLLDYIRYGNYDHLH